eukprot:GGOE01036243.1.p1 GENE.GGOE01036243.1~~GGOE01036243.1.p1  ORF type:complete len:389 (+),score=44.87 GGOE01036243.1:47-1168(+)
MDADNEGQQAFLARMKASINQRRNNPFSDNVGYAIVNPEQDKTLLMREVDQMNEDEILSLFPQFKDDITSIRLFPPIPGTRGFCFIEFKDAMTAIRAFTYRHRSTFMYRGTPKKCNLQRPTKGKPADDEVKWAKYQERQRRNDGKTEFDSTPRRMSFMPGQPGPHSQDDQGAVQTVPFTQVLQGLSKASRDDPADNSRGQASSTDDNQGASPPPSDSKPKEEHREESPRRERPREDSSRDRDRQEARRASPDRRRSPPPPRDSRRDDSRKDDRRSGDSRRPLDSLDRDPFRAPARRSPPREDRGYRNPFLDERRNDDRRGDDRRSGSDRRPSYDRRDPFADRGRDSRDDDHDDRKRRRVDDDDHKRGSSRDYR